MVLQVLLWLQRDQYKLIEEDKYFFSSSGYTRVHHGISRVDPNPVLVSFDLEELKSSDQL